MSELTDYSRPLPERLTAAAKLYSVRSVFGLDALLYEAAAALKIAQALVASQGDEADEV